MRAPLIALHKRTRSRIALIVARTVPAFSDLSQSRAVLGACHEPAIPGIALVIAAAGSSLHYLSWILGRYSGPTTAVGPASSAVVADAAVRIAMNIFAAWSIGSDFSLNRAIGGAEIVEAHVRIVFISVVASGAAADFVIGLFGQAGNSGEDFRQRRGCHLDHNNLPNVTMTRAIQK